MEVPAAIAAMSSATTLKSVMQTKQLSARNVLELKAEVSLTNYTEKK